MDAKSRALHQFQKHYKKIIFILSSAIIIYLAGKYSIKKMFPRKGRKREPLKDFPTLEDIQKFIEDLPYDSQKMGKTITLKDLLGELSEFSEDEEWKELIASVNSLYNDSPKTTTEKNSVNQSLV